LKGAVSAFGLIYISSLGYFITPIYLSGGKIILPGNEIQSRLEVGDYDRISIVGAGYLLHSMPLLCVLFFTLSRFGSELGRSSDDPSYNCSVQPPSPIRIGLLLLSSVPVYLSLLPVFYCVIWAFFGTEVVGRLHNFSLTNFYFDWLGEKIIASMLLTYFLAAIAVGLSTILLLAILFDDRVNPANRIAFFELVLFVPLLLPMPIYAISILEIVGSRRAFQPLIEIVAMTLFATPVVYMILGDSKSSLPANRVRASLILGASFWSSLTNVVLPSLRIPIMASVLCGFFYAIDEVVVASFVWDGRPEPIAKRLLDESRNNSSPLAAVVTIANVLFVLSVAFIVAKIYSWNFQKLED
jgi:putative spermidine/putrescine transport system permease protein